MRRNRILAVAATVVMLAPLPVVIALSVHELWIEAGVVTVAWSLLTVCIAIWAIMRR